MTHMQTVAVPDHERPPKAVTASRNFAQAEVASRKLRTRARNVSTLWATALASDTTASPCGVSFGLRVVPRSNSESPSCASRVSRMYAKQYDLKLVKAPFDIPPIELQMQWHKYRDQDPAVAWFRELLQSVAREI
jgi:DNA-binding transcriptional LysR family regulator